MKVILSKYIEQNIWEDKSAYIYMLLTCSYRITLVYTQCKQIQKKPHAWKPKFPVRTNRSESENKTSARRKPIRTKNSLWLVAPGAKRDTRSKLPSPRPFCVYVWFHFQRVTSFYVKWCCADLIDAGVDFFSRSLFHDARNNIALGIGIMLSAAVCLMSDIALDEGRWVSRQREIVSALSTQQAYGAIDKYWVSSIMTHPARRMLLVPHSPSCVTPATLQIAIWSRGREKLEQSPSTFQISFGHKKVI